MVYQEIDVNLFYTGGPPQHIYITQGDTTLGGFKFNIIYENEYWKIPSGYVFYLNGVRPDGYVFSYPCRYSGHTVTCVVEDSMTDFPGEILCTLEVYDGSNGKVGAQEIRVYNSRNALSNTKLTGNDFKSIERALRAAASIPTIEFFYTNSTETIHFNKS